MSNNHLVLVSGKATTGKSLSLRNIKKPEGVMYLNCESNKKLPFKSEFYELTIVDPNQIYEAFAMAETRADIHTIVIDSLTYMMDMYESVHVNTSNDGRKAWGEYATFFKVLMSQYVARSTKNVIFTAHTQDIMNEKEMVMESLVKVKGSLMATGIESAFSMIVSTKRVSMKDLEGIENDLLHISDKERRQGFKYVFQTDLTAKTMNERMRAPLDMWAENELYIDNDLEQVITRLHEYYGTTAK